MEKDFNLKERRGGYIGGLEAGEKKREMPLKCNLKNNQFVFVFWFSSKFCFILGRRSPGQWTDVGIGDGCDEIHDVKPTNKH